MDEPEKRPPIGAILVHKLTKQQVIVLDHEGAAVNASPWFTIRDANMLTHRMRIEEIDTDTAQSAVQQRQSSGPYL